MQSTRQRFSRVGRSPATATVTHPFNALGPLIGRDHEFAELRAQMLAPMVRLVTLTGPAGVGKSRLAAALFNETCGRFAGGGHFLDLAEVSAEKDLAECMAAELTDDATSKPSPLSRLAAYLEQREFLLIIDHCEHVMESVVSTISSLLITCPELRVLVSSQEPSHIYGGSVFRLAPLAVPGPDLSDEELKRSGSVALFLMRTSATRPGFRLTSENQETVTELCRRLDGLPLAIELAAARMKLLTPEALLQELDDGLGSMQASRGDTLSRHLSMDAAISHNCARLTPEERVLFNRLSVFTSEFGLKTADAVIRPQGGSVQDLLEGLVDKNLLVARDMANGELGFSTLKTTRSYALGELRRSGELERIKRSHATYFLATAQAAEPEFGGRDQKRWFTQFSDWGDELSTVFSFFVGRGEGGKAAALAASLRPYWSMSGRLREGLHLLVKAQAIGGLTEELEAKTLDTAGELAAALGDPRAKELLTRSLELYQTLRDQRGAAACLHHLGKLSYLLGEVDTARRMLEEAVSVRRSMGDISGYATATCDLAQLLHDLGELNAAQQSAETARRSFEKIENAHGVARTSYLLASITAAEGRIDDQAEELCRAGTRILNDLNERPTLTSGMEVTAVLLSLRGRTREGWRGVAALLAAARTARNTIGCPLSAYQRSVIEDVTERARIRLGLDMFRTAWDEGRRMSLSEAAAYALAPSTWEQAAIRRLDTELETPLTPREQQVAELVAYGLTNREIARRLGIAEWTAVNHLRKVMRKLNCSSRVQVANWVANQRDVTDAG